MWLSLTVAFEFLFMHYVAGLPWVRLVHDYNVFAGRVWVVVLIWVTATPYVFYRLQTQSSTTPPLLRVVAGTAPDCDRG